jgi:NAD(P)-dependent dehydrogenase (short-subunit alcohol dehydrogenase family)
MSRDVMGDFTGLNVVVTGGTGALGSAVVGLLLDGGAVCHIPNLHAGELDRFPHKGKVQLIEGVELTDEAAVERLYARFSGGESGGGGGVRLWASIHIAGGFAMGPIEQVGKDDFVKQMQMNALTCFLCCREAVKRMSGGGGAGAGGRIVNVAARPGLIPEQGAGMVAYTASKAAVAAITQALGAEVAGRGILVNAVVPSIMDTPANRKSMPNADFSKWPKVAEVAATIAFLASPANTVTRGGLVPVYGRS